MLVAIFMLTLVFAIAGYAVDTGLYLVKRQELQTLATSVSMAAAYSLPFVANDRVKTSAETWYEALRVDDTYRQLAPPLSVAGTLEISFNDNRAIADNDTAFKVSSVTAKVAAKYNGQFFPIFGSSLGDVDLAGKATVHLVPTDVVLIIENSASLLANPSSGAAVASFTANYPNEAAAYAEQCFSTPFKKYKQGIVQLYDALSQIETFRVAVITRHSFSGDPFMLADFGETEIRADRLEDNQDLPDYHSSRCAAATPENLVPTPINSAVWNPRTNLTGLMPNFATGVYTIPAATMLLTREALWMMQAGYSTESGFIPPRFYYGSSIASIDLAARMLEDSRRDDNLPVVHRYIILVTDDNGTVPDYIINPEDPTATFTEDPCDYWLENAATAGFRDTITFGLINYSYNTSLERHNASDLLSTDPIPFLREHCSKPNVQGEKVFYAESSVAVFPASTADTFSTLLMPMVAHSLKAVELRK